jgi:hypothetical protein
VAKKHHGEIAVFSDPGDTKFRVWLPLTAQSPDDAVTEPGQPGAEPAAQEQEKETTS